MQQLANLRAMAQRLHPAFKGGLVRRRRGGHPFDIATGAKRVARAGQHHRTHAVVGGGMAQGIMQHTV